MALGVEETLATIAEIQSTAVDAIKLAKDASAGGLHWGEVLGDVIRIAVDAKALATDAPLALPELKDLQADEVAKIGAAAYTCVMAVLAAVKA